MRERTGLGTGCIMGLRSGVQGPSHRCLGAYIYTEQLATGKKRGACDY